MDALARLRARSDYQQGVHWGEPRPGHPEGEIADHIAELEQNLDAVSGLLDSVEIHQLRLMVHVHDTYKFQVLKGGPSHEAIAASVFHELLPDEQDIERMLACHDQMFRLWRSCQAGDDVTSKVDALVKSVRNWSLFTTFMLIDNMTAGKDPRPIAWMLDELEARNVLPGDARAMNALIEEDLGSRAPSPTLGRS